VDGERGERSLTFVDCIRVLVQALQVTRDTQQVPSPGIFLLALLPERPAPIGMIMLERLKLGNPNYDSIGGETVDYAPLECGRPV
jgi:hypothetical protein